jgi:mono/diheme cytochrome c family protein
MDDQSDDAKAMSIQVFLDDDKLPLATYRPPATLTIDTKKLADGEHVLQLRAVDALGNVGQRTIPFTVANGPGITVTGLRPGAAVHGTLALNLNAFSGEEPFSPVRAESQGPVPVWVWVMCALVAAWALWYGIEFFKTPPKFANTPTYASNPALAAANEPAAGPHTQMAPRFTGKGVVAGFDFVASGAAAFAANCESCHGANGQGVAGVFPPLARDPVVTADDPKQQIAIVLHGLHGVAIAGRSYAAAMPSFAQMPDEEIAAIIDHERTSWGNRAPTITPSAVKRAR